MLLWSTVATATELFPAKTCLSALTAACSLEVRTSGISPDLWWGTEGEVRNISTGQGALRTQEAVWCPHRNLRCRIFPAWLQPLYNNTVPVWKLHLTPANVLSQWQEFPLWDDGNPQPMSENTKLCSKWPAAISLVQRKTQVSNGLPGLQLVSREEPKAPQSILFFTVHIKMHICSHNQWKWPCEKSMQDKGKSPLFQYW